ncbi:ER membrane protein complex subunit 3 [Aphelenchoides bicaudatus]|nr:ER membrane protein complex subunit 3 [Aphelenchoides bicaudatus]
MTDLLLDPAIRTWVFIPIIVITFLVGIVRHFAFLILNNKPVDLDKMKDGHYLAKSQLLRENGNVLPANSFGMRKHFLADEKEGYLTGRIEEFDSKPDQMDPEVIIDMLKGQMLNMVPMLFIGGWINWTFSGFVTTKPMLQRGVSLDSLNASWVSSASWYFLSVFGLRSIYNLVLGGENVADTAMQKQTPGNFAVASNPKQAFRDELEALQMCSHKFEP